MKYVENKETFPFVVPVRNAKEALISHYIHAKKLYNVEKSATNIELQIRNIKDMWEFVLQNDKFFIAPFKEFTQDPRDFFDKLEKKYPELRRKINLHFYIDEIYESLRNYEVETIPKDVYLEIGHYPREKSEFYDEAVFELNLDKYKKSLEHLNNLEKELVSRYKWL